MRGGLSFPMREEYATMIVIAEIKTNEGQLLGLITVNPKDFKTGSKGFYGNGKVLFDEKRYQLQVQLVEIGSGKKEKEAS